ncbi:MAG: two-component system sensor histidine kinase ZraS [Desulfovibrio sp.]|nr:two-component system sensor histidine kinase ZraS [Desulfovibrio sp.]
MQILVMLLLSNGIFAMISAKQQQHSKSVFFFSAVVLRILLCAFLFLLLMLWASISATKQAEHSMEQLLGEKGASLLSVCESILRSGMRHEIGIRLQVLLEEMTTNRDLQFACVTMPDGTIIAHSDFKRVGEILRSDGKEVVPSFLEGLAPSEKAKYRFLNLEGHRVFVVYRTFFSKFIPNVYEKPVIFLGLDVSPFRRMRTQNRIYMSIVAGISIMLLGACFVAVYFSARAKVSAAEQKKAEGLVRELEDEVRRKEKLAAIGSLAAGVAHEIRNPLSSIKGYATYFGERFSEGSSDRMCAQAMVQEVDRLNSVITDLIGLSKSSNIVAHPLDVQALFNQIALVIQPNCQAKQSKLHQIVHSHLPTVLADAWQLEQALLNLFLNALDAGAKNIWLCGRRLKTDLCLLVLDDGQGIAEDVLPHIFDPYFTTRSKGTGLGLALVHKIVEAHHGHIVVKSKIGTDLSCGKTAFCILLPANKDAHAGTHFDC